MILARGFFLSPTAWNRDARRLFLVTLPILWPVWLVAWFAAFTVALAAIAVVLLTEWCSALWSKP